MLAALLVLQSSLAAVAEGGGGSGNGLVCYFGSCQGGPRVVDQLIPVPPGYGWLYLGRFKAGSWKEPSSEELAGYTPEELQGDSLRIDKDLNVRKGPMGCHATDPVPAVVGSIKRGNSAEIIQVLHLPGCRTYIWAKVKYQ
jgi:hypothetical protein